MDADFLIIGGGIAGISAAARLGQLGSVIVLEAEDTLAYHASGRSAAMYEPYYGAPAVVGLSLASGAYFRAQPGVLAPRGMLMVGKATEADAIAREAEAMQLALIPVEAALALVPVLNPATIAYAAMAMHAWDIDTDLLVQGFAREARALGAEFRLKARVTVIGRIAGGWSVMAGGVEITARQIVNAAGAWADQVAVLARVRPLGLQPMRRSMARIPAPGGHDTRGWPMQIGRAHV